MKKLCRFLLAVLIAGTVVNFTQSAFAKSKSVNEKAAIGYGVGNEYVQKYLDNKDVRQLILVEQSAKKKRLGTLYLLEKNEDNKWLETLRCGAFLGKKGLYKTKEGDKRTPVGDYGIRMAFGIKDNPGAKMVYTKLTDKMDICGERENYNQFVDVTKVNHKCGEDGERLIDYVPQFNYVLFIDYNKEGVFGKGSAIFLHCQGTHKYTHGCVAITEDNMVKVMHCGFIVDGEGKKQSKSKGNVIDPADVMNKYGADVLRL